MNESRGSVKLSAFTREELARAIDHAERRLGYDPPIRFGFRSGILTYYRKGVSFLFLVYSVAWYYYATHNQIFEELPHNPSGWFMGLQPAVIVLFWLAYYAAAHFADIRTAAVEREAASKILTEALDGIRQEEESDIGESIEGASSNTRTGDLVFNNMCDWLHGCYPGVYPLHDRILQWGEVRVESTDEYAKQKRSFVGTVYYILTYLIASFGPWLYIQQGLPILVPALTMLVMQIVMAVFPKGVAFGVAKDKAVHGLIEIAEKELSNEPE